MTETPIRKGIREVISQRQIEFDVRAEVAKVKREQIVKPVQEPRCRICQHEDSRNMVNKMLSYAMTYAEILRMCELAVNPSRAKNNKISYKSVMNHAIKHFNLEEPTKAVYRAILERRANEMELAGEGVGRLLTALGYLDVVAQKGYETLVEPTTTISPTLGMEAIVKLHQLTRKGAGEQEAAELRQRLAVVESAVKDVVPQEYWSEIISRIEDAEGRVHEDTLDVEVVDDYDDDGEAYSPPVEADADDTLES